ncbi:MULTISPECIES: nucleotidyltransferase family protein [Spongiibacter]|uniref:nucleotidyltransferase family protein n=1 Tax=Spongiibacter TaxID=630749 RepID=UPI000C38849B|nr:MULTISPECIES: nucleotidyltransferase family protein [Spongiibacter]MAY37602.1 CTP--molybdopterin cytidylyltransferase [Spongiibacter sp.]MBO6753241.1 nucleotidyltransferase family protein [Spongiibacter sp.]
MAIPIFLLAAGLSQRFGEADKRLAELRPGCSMLAAMQRRAARAGLDVNTILRDTDRHLVLGETSIGRCWYATCAHQGMGSSLAEGLAQWLAAQGAGGNMPLPDALLVMPADLPLLRVSTVAAVSQAAASDCIVRPRCAGKTGHPVAFGRQFWPELLALEGEFGARALIQANAERLNDVDVQDEGIYLDADTPEQFEQLRARLQHF